MIQSSEILLSWKFREGGGNRLDQFIPPIALLLWGIFIVVGLGYWVYLRFFYKYRKWKDGSFMDKRVQEDAQAKKVEDDRRNIEKNLKASYQDVHKGKKSVMKK